MSTPSQAEVRRMIAAAGTIVVKVGSSSLTQPSGHLDPDKLDALAAALAQVRLMGGRVVLVSSGAIAAGFGPLGFDSRPVDVATQQATAAVGQGLLMARYETAFGRFGIRVGQILITAEDTILRRRERVTIDSRCVISRFGVARPSSSCCYRRIRSCGRPSCRTRPRNRTSRSGIRPRTGPRRRRAGRRAC